MSSFHALVLTGRDLTGGEVARLARGGARVAPRDEDRELAPDLAAAEAFRDDGLDPHLEGPG